MLRKTGRNCSIFVGDHNASMRPQRNAAENSDRSVVPSLSARASMRPQRNAAENDDT